MDEEMFSEAYLEPTWTTMMKLFKKMINRVI